MYRQGTSRGRPDKRSQGWNSVNRVRPPPGLRGRDLGMFYRHMSKMGKKRKRELIIKLTIPPVVLNKLLNNITEIINIAKQRNIHIPQLKKTIFSKSKDELDDSNIKKEIKFEPEIKVEPIKEEKDESICHSKKPNESILKSDFIPLSDEDVKPSTSSTSYFITSNIGQPSKYDISEQLLNLRGAGDYKYSYYDIITGSFDEKLEECLSNGITINKRTEDIESLNSQYYNEYKTMINSKGYKNMKKFRETLPTYKKSKEILDVINSNQIIVISGETGCGKSTQVPQIILDDAICNNRGANVKILVTQPRRIAASSLALRVAEERGEKIGASVGYAVRLERAEERARGSIMFCTTGILLADLEVNQGLTSFSHVILDEVHERDCHIDLSMCMLKQVLKRRKDLTLILMSATIDAEQLTAYFDNCPMMHIEGLAYPVQSFYLEHVLGITKYKLPENKPKNFGDKKWHKYKKNHVSESDMQKDIQYKAEIGNWLESKKRGLDPQVYETLKDWRIEDMHMDLIYDLLIQISKQEPGAVLVFLPGINDITKLLRMMEEGNQFPPNRFSIYPLHSKLPTLDQHKIFQRPPPNVRKIIIATNIAETSITIDDVVYVVDSGKMKCTGLNVDDNISTLGIEWVSQANLRQRRGRAGRCQPGICYHLVTSYRASVLSERVLPELQRSNLLEPVLAIKKLRLGIAAEALKMVPGPPAETTVRWAVKHLQQ